MRELREWLVSLPNNVLLKIAKDQGRGTGHIPTDIEFIIEQAKAYRWNVQDLAARYPVANAEYRVMYQTGPRSIKVKWCESFIEAENFAKSQKRGGLVYSNVTGSLVGNFTSTPTTGCADYVVGLR